MRRIPMELLESCLLSLSTALALCGGWGILSIDAAAIRMG